MRNTGLVIIAASILLGLGGARAAEDSEKTRTMFATVKVFVDSGEAGLGAYQFELKTTCGSVKIVGIEGGEHAAYKDAPYYDPAAMASDRVIIGAFSMSKDLPTGRTRVATVHVMIEGDIKPEYEVALMTAGDADGNEITAKITLAKGE